MSGFFNDGRPTPDSGAGRRFVKELWSTVRSIRDLPVPDEARDLDSYRSKTCNQYFEILSIDPMCNEIGLCDQMQWRICELDRRIGLDNKTLEADMNRIRFNCARNMVWSALRFVVKRYWDFQRSLKKLDYDLDSDGLAALEASHAEVTRRTDRGPPATVIVDSDDEVIPETPPPAGHAEKAKQETIFTRARSEAATSAQGAAAARGRGRVRLAPYSRMRAALDSAPRAPRPQPTFSSDDVIAICPPSPKKRARLVRRMTSDETLAADALYDAPDLTQGLDGYDL